jgi:hypothetical protein
MDIITLYNDYGVEHLTEGNKHCSPGWVNTHCPFCEGSNNYHLGYNFNNNYFVCYRCGWHPVSKAISLLIGISEGQVRDIVKRYGILVPRLIKTPDVKVEKREFSIPTDCSVLLDHHAKYLRKRKFDVEDIMNIWYIMSTGPTSILDVIRNGKRILLNYRHRILIPFYWNGKMVSFDARDVTGKAINKYYACPKERELIEHKSILYCKQEALQDTAICVEGPTDVWRFGVNSFATSGIKYTPAQVRLMARMFKRVPVCFDGGEPQAIAQANKLVADLKFRGVDSFRVDIEGDPGNMEQGEANYLVKQLIK